MTTTIAQAMWHGNTDANFRTSMKHISDAFATLGWAKGSDTGQINWTTVLKPTLTGSASMVGFEIWKMADALQATNPVFIKIEYGAANAIQRPAIKVSVGSGTDGAGNLTNPTPTLYLNPWSYEDGRVDIKHLYSGGPGRFQMYTCYDRVDGSYSVPIFLSIDREYTTGGVPGDQGAVITWSNRNIPTVAVPYPIGAFTPYTQTIGYDCGTIHWRKDGKFRVSKPLNPIPDGSPMYTTQFDYNKYGIFPFLSWGIDGLVAPTGNILVAPVGDVPPLSPIKIKWLGTLQTYIPLWNIDAEGKVYTSQSCCPDSLKNTTYNMGIIMRWE